MLKVAQLRMYSETTRSDSILENTLRESQEIKYARGINYSLTALSANEIIQGNYESALKFIQQGQEYSKKAPIKGDQVKFLNLQSVVEYYQGKYQKGIESNLEILKIVDEEGRRIDRFNAYNNIGINYERLEEYDKALEYYEKALETSTKINAEYYIAAVNANIGIIHKNRKNFAEAKNRFIESNALAEKINHKSLLLDGLHNLADVYIEENNISEADKVIRRSRKIAEETNDQNGMIRNLALEGVLQYHQQVYPSAISALKKALSKAREIGDHEQLLGIYQYLHQSYRQIGQTDSAYQYLSTFTTVKDSMFDLEKATRLNQLETAYQLSEKDKEILTQQLEIEQKTKQRNLFIGGAFLIGFLGLSSYFFLRRIIRDQKKLNRQNEILHRSEIEKLNTEKKLISLDSMVNGQEEERKRIAKDLHDSLGSLMATIKGHFSALKNDYREITPAKYEKTDKLIDEACDEVRRISHNMMPQALIENGLVDALRDLANNYAESEGWNVDFEIHGMEKRLNQTQEQTIFRIVQELITNISKHGLAQNILIQMIRKDGSLLLTVEDDGRGFNPDDPGSLPGIGLRNIRSRVDYLNGSLNLDSVAGEGTTVSINIPIQHEYIVVS